MKDPFLSPLVDLSVVRIDPALPGGERLRLFAEQTGDPYRFCAAGTPVEVIYTDGAPSLQQVLTGLCSRPQ